MQFFTETGWHAWIYKEGKKNLTQSILDEFNEMKGPDYILPYLIAQHVVISGKVKRKLAWWYTRFYTE